MTDADVIVVGAGPAGSAAALVAARAGKRVILLERGPFPGSKNMYGGVVYGRILDSLIPNWWEEIPVQRWITKRSTMVLNGTQSLNVDYRTDAWARPPYNGCTTLRPEFDSWLAGHAERAGAVVVCSTVVTGVVKTDGSVTGVMTDRGDSLTAPIVIACDGVNSFIAKDCGLYPNFSADHFTLGVKEVLRLPRATIEQRFNVRGTNGVDIEIVGGTQGVAGGGFIYTNLDTVSVGAVLSLKQLGASGIRPEAVIAGLKEHPSIAPLVEGGELVEYSAHVIPEAGYDHMPTMVADGLMIAGDAAALCLAAGLWLEGVNFAIGSGMAAGATAVEAIDRNDTTAAGALASYRRRMEADFTLADHKKLRGAPGLILSDRMQNRYPQLICNIAEAMFTVTNPIPKKGARRIMRRELKAAGLRRRDVVRDMFNANKSFG